MRIGIDFDNTIACYDGVFHRAALERSLIPPDLATSKNAVRDYLNECGRNDEFTELQGYIYGTRMDLVAPYSGVGAFIGAARAAGHELFLVSHKTRHPILGPRYDLHEAARRFLAAHRLIGECGIPPRNVFFDECKEDKVARAARLACDAFIDDLPEILCMEAFPLSARAILFDPDGHFPGGCWNGRLIERYADWPSIETALLR